MRRPVNSFADKKWYQRGIAEARDKDRMRELRRINRERFWTDDEWAEWRRLVAKYGVTFTNRKAVTG